MKTSRPIDKDRHYWYVTYAYSNRVGDHGDGSIIIDTTEDWFPILTAREFIKSNCRYDVVVIKNWIKITHQQAEEHRE